MMDLWISIELGMIISLLVVMVLKINKINYGKTKTINNNKKAMVRK